MTLLEYLSFVMPDECSEVRMTDYTRRLLLHERDAMRHMDVAPYPPDSDHAPFTIRARPIVVVFGTEHVNSMVWFVTPTRTWSVGWSK